MDDIREKERKKKKEDAGISVLEKKYWIKPGIEVCHREFPGRKMIVDKIIRQGKKIKIGEKEEMKTFVVGVDCHWLDSEGNYCKGVFFTRELVPFKGEDLKDEKTGGSAGT